MGVVNDLDEVAFCEGTFSKQFDGKEKVSSVSGKQVDVFF